MARKKTGFKAYPAKAEGLDPITVALAGVLILAAVCSWRVHRAAGSVIDLAVDKNTYTTLIVEHQDGSKDLQADNEKLAEEVNQGRAGLANAQTEAVVMMIVCGGVGAALAVRVWKQSNA